jgi:integrase
VSREDFIESGTVLRVAWQASGNGGKREPLKHRLAGEYRDVPVPSWLWAMVRDMPDGPLILGNGRLFQHYGTIYFRFMHAAEAAGIADGFSPHSLRHAYASAMLARPDHRACPLPRPSGHQRDSPGVRASAALCCQASRSGTGRRVC